MSGLAVPPFAPGDEIQYRFRRTDGSLGTVHPARVVSDDGDRLLCWVLAGTDIRITTDVQGRTPREMPLDERFALGRVPARSTWRGTSTLRLVFEHRWSSVWWFFDAQGRFRNWYVNLEVPAGRTDRGVERIDGVLDVEVFPDGRWCWKDEDELDPALSAGRLRESQLRGLRDEGERMIELAVAGQFPFDGSYTDARPDPGWRLPHLPAELLS